MVADVTIVGAGIVALTTAIALGDRGIAVRVVGTSHRGEASEAAGGLLTPFMEPELAPIRELAVAARDQYVDYVAMLADRTGITVPLNRAGALRVALTESGVAELRDKSNECSEWLDRTELARLEPALAHALGANFYPNDGCTDPLPLLDALRTLVARHAHITVASENVCELKLLSAGAEVITDREGHYSADVVVLAAGAWTPSIPGIPRPLPITPLKGQMVAYGSAHAQAAVRHVVFGPAGYLVPKADGHLVAGSTLEETGFEAEVTEAGIAQIRGMAEALCPPRADTPVAASWAGLRPMTPDMLPIVGPDPDAPQIVYASGHSRNGILLAPLTADAVADFVTGTMPSHAVDQFRPGRF